MKEGFSDRQLGRAGSVLLAVTLAAGCGSTASEAPKANTQPGISQTPIVEQSTMPSQSITVELTPAPTETQGPLIVPPAVAGTPPPTESPTPKPTPKETPKPIPTTLEGIINGNHPQITSKTMIESINAATNSKTGDPSAFDQRFLLLDLPNNIKVCDGAIISQSGNLAVQQRQQVCESLAENFWFTYTTSKNKKVLTAFYDIYNYTISKYGLGPSFKPVMDKTLLSVFP